MIFGGTGDLAQRKLLPALYNLAHEGQLPERFNLIAFARREQPHDEYQRMARESIEQHSRTEFREDVWRRLADEVCFVPGAFDDDAAFDKLAEQLVELESTHGIEGNAAFYLSIPPSMFPTVLKQMQRTGMANNQQSGGWRRVVVEKPFGHDLASSRELNALVDDVFTAQDVFQ